MELVKWEAMKSAIAECKTIDEVKVIRDKAEALRQYAKQSKESLELQNEISEIKIRADIRIGEISSEIPTEQGMRSDIPTSVTSEPKSKRDVLKEAGISHRVAVNCEALAKQKWTVEEAIQEAKTKKKELTTSYVLSVAKTENNKATKQKKAEEGSKVTVTYDDLHIFQGDFYKVLDSIPDGSLDLILTDPPYPYEFIECWSNLSSFASRKLKVNGFCIAYSGQTNLVDVMNRMSEHLDYYWTFSLVHTGQKQLITHRNIFCGWKPLLIFQNGKKKQESTCEDVITGSGMEKTFHKWQQAEAELVPIIEHFTQPGQVICDPFLGGGTTAVVSHTLKRKFIGAEIDEQQYNIAKGRIYGR